MSEEIDLHDALGAVFGRGFELFEGVTVYNLDGEEPEPEETQNDGDKKES